MDLKYKVNLNNVGKGSADKVYGGYLNAYSFKDILFENWIDQFRKALLSKMGKEYFPVYRMADGEYRFLMGRKYNFHRKPLWKELLAVAAEKVRIKNPDKWKTSWGEEYNPDKVKALRKKLIQDVRYISEKGLLACYLNENGLNAFVEHNKYIIPFFEKHHIKFDEFNYIPFHFVCSILVTNGWQDFYKNKKILIVTGSNDDSENKIKDTILSFGASKVLFLRISKTTSMEEILDLTSITDRIDLCMVAAGIGSANILRKLEPLRTVTLDIGGFINCYVDVNSSQHGGIFKSPI
jgi:hypothetical protein